MGQEIHHLLPYAVNFSIVIALLMVLTRNPLKKFLFQRHERIQDQVLSSEKQFQAAKLKNDSLQAQKSALQNEFKALEAREKEAAEASTKKLLASANEESRRIESESKRLAVNEAEDSGAKMKQEFVDEIIHRTEAALLNGLGNDAHSGVLARAKNSMEAEVS